MKLHAQCAQTLTCARTHTRTPTMNATTAPEADSEPRRCPQYAIATAPATADSSCTASPNAWLASSATPPAPRTATFLAMASVRAQAPARRRGGIGSSRLDMAALGSWGMLSREDSSWDRAACARATAASTSGLLLVLVLVLLCAWPVPVMLGVLEEWGQLELLLLLLVAGVGRLRDACAGSGGGA